MAAERRAQPAVAAVAHRQRLMATDTDTEADTGIDTDTYGMNVHEL